jgi:hypothetical protein
MTKTLNIDVNLFEKLERQAKIMFIDVNSYAENVLAKSVNDNDFENYDFFENYPKPKNSKSIPGLAKGRSWIADDFDEPLDCLKEYME